MTDAPFTETHRETLLWMGGILAHRGQRDASNAAIKEIERLTLLVQACGNTECMPLVEVDRLRSALTAIETLYATRGWSDGFRERLRQILDGVKTP